MLWTDNIWYEENRAWFVSGEYNALFELEDESRKCRFIDVIPGSDLKSERYNPRCMKCGENIYCFPYRGTCIWVYNLNQKEFSQIELINPSGAEAIIADFWQHKNSIFAVSVGLKQIIEIDVINRKIVQYYNITMDEKEILGRSSRIGNSIFTWSITKKGVYEFEILEGNVTCYPCPLIDDDIWRMCFDGRRFWLSGCARAVYVWDKETNATTIIDNFPKDFGVYDFCDKQEEILNSKITKYEESAFLESICTEKYIWLIPFRTNYILYIDKEIYEVKYLDIVEEEENRSTMKSAERGLNHKFLWLYYRDNRMLGLYSLKNNQILEIDTQNATWKYKEMKVDVDSKAFAELILKYNEGVIKEQKRITNLDFFLKVLCSDE